MFLHELKSPKGSREKKFRPGRGPGSAMGKTSGRGHKSQRSRSGRGIILGSEGGQMPLIRRLPKVGFNTLNPIVYQIVHLDALNRFDAGSIVGVHNLKKEKLLAILAEKQDGKLSKLSEDELHKRIAALEV